MTKEEAEAPADAEKVIALINSKLPAKTFGDAINSGQTRADHRADARKHEPQPHGLVLSAARLD